MQIDVLKEHKALGYLWAFVSQNDKKEGKKILEQP